MNCCDPFIVLELVNQERRERNIPPLELDQRLMDVIQFQVDYCADNNTLTHSNPAGSLGDRFSMFNYQFRSSGENLAEGYGRDEEIRVVKSWMNSPGHRANILNGSYKHMGVGFKNSFWGQAFGSLLNNGPAIPVSTSIPVPITPDTPDTPDTSSNSHTIKYTTTTTRYTFSYSQ
ncbi:6552_t:CDS:2 [Diversispora eburnea]|uniref:6552_t:CDS:1 n=1 Tax=Diversispora eburnea TaxID=1213867 RepID=A0A9N8V623_9GLOM|nr:6552_t:CDS:2 [Diversispora eburnea]